MKVLHTSDWHIGKRLLGRERIGEQREVLREIAALCERERVELVLVAGDVFDTYLPSSEAEDLFYTSVRELAGKDRAVVIISGNHDDHIRLAAATPFPAPFRTCPLSPPCARRIPSARARILWKWKTRRANACFSIYCRIPRKRA